MSGSTIYVSFKTADSFELYKTTDIGCLVGGTSEHVWKKTAFVPTKPKDLWSRIYVDKTAPTVAT